MVGIAVDRTYRLRLAGYGCDKVRDTQAAVVGFRFKAGKMESAGLLCLPPLRPVLPAEVAAPTPAPAPEAKPLETASGSELSVPLLSARTPHIMSGKAGCNKTSMRVMPLEGRYPTRFGRVMAAFFESNRSRNNTAVQT